ncbi:ferredoxin [Actinoplanes sp. NPDC026619]|uniref:ferredoxin n=1 Tax=Actinoplanes sp. NPDC026619 TaxID=3155798 RepID=UPI0033E9A4FC
MRARVDPEKCMGHGMCEALASEVYEVNEETGYNEMGEFETPDERRAAVLKGMTGCPEQAISILVDAPSAAR